jgi:hypothetical protein
VNTAQQEVLMCLPGLGTNDVAALESYRASSNVNLTSTAWVAQALGATKAAAIAQYITVASYQFSADIVAVTGDGRAFKRYRTVLDATESPPTVLYWKDVTYLGWPLSPDIRTTMQSGAPPPDAGTISSTSPSTSTSATAGSTKSASSTGGSTKSASSTGGSTK